MFPKKHLCGNKRKRSSLRILSIFSNVFCVSNRKKSDGKPVTLTQHLPDIGCGTLPNTILTLIKTDNALIENRISRHVWLKTYHRWSHKLPNPKLIFKNCRIKACFDALVYDLLSFKTISPFFNVCTVWLYTLSQCIGEQNHLASHIIIHWRSYALDYCRKLQFIPS